MLYAIIASHGYGCHGATMHRIDEVHRRSDDAVERGRPAPTSQQRLSGDQTARRIKVRKELGFSSHPGESSRNNMEAQKLLGALGVPRHASRKIDGETRETNHN